MEAGGPKNHKKVHMVLVHGSCHGAWCWYKVRPLLEAAGHRVSALDMAASGVHTKQLLELRGMADYTSPLLKLVAAAPVEEELVLVGHSFGGMSLALAMEMYPGKIAAAIFLTAFMPDYVHPPSYVLQQFFERTPPEWLDTQFLQRGTTEEPLTSMLFGPHFVSSKLYNLCSPQDVALANMLLRPTSMFIDELSKTTPFTKEGYGSVKRVYIACARDEGIPLSFQRWLIDAIGADKVIEMGSADHMAMLSEPNDLCRCLLDIVDNHASY